MTYFGVNQAAHLHLFVEELHGGLLGTAEGNITDVDSASLSRYCRVDGHRHGDVGTTRELRIFPAAGTLLHQRVDSFMNGSEITIY